MIPEEELQAMQARADAATPETWRHVIHGLEDVVEFDEGYYSNSIKPSDARFISHSRQDIPRLIQEIRMLREMNAVMKEDLRFTLYHTKHLLKPDQRLPEGLGPWAYLTLTYEGDLELINRVKEIESRYEKEKEK